MRKRRLILLAAALLGTGAAFAQTVVQVAPPAPAVEVFVQWLPDPGTSGPPAITGGMAAAAYGFRGDGFILLARESSGARALGPALRRMGLD